MTDLDALEVALVQAGYCGEWAVGVTKDSRSFVETTQRGNDGAIYGLNAWSSDCENPTDIAEARLIVGAVNALPALIQELRNLRAKGSP